MGVVVGLELPTRRKECKVIDDMWGLMESVLEGVMDDGWQNLDQDLIASCYHAPHKWVPLMRRIVVAAEYVWATARGDDATKEEDRSKEGIES